MMITHGYARLNPGKHLRVVDGVDPCGVETDAGLTQTG
jgi:hypothetical protein